MAAGIYISYRRDDAAAAAGQLAGDLVRALGSDRVVFDVDTLAPGQDFRQALRDAVGRCTVMLVLIGRHWLAGTDARGQRRLERPDDAIRLEIAAAFEQDLHVVPVLLAGAACPLPDDLPPDLAPLVRRQAIELSDDRWTRDVDMLVQVLTRLPGLALRGRPTPVLDRPLAADAPVKAPAREPDRPEIFVSYAFEDETWAQQAVAALESKGYRCWLASRDVAPGSASYAREITRAIKASRLLVVVLSHAANGSDDVLNEITLAKNNRVPRLPFRVDDAPLDDGFEYFFSQAQRLDTAHLAPGEAVARLVQAVGRQIGPPLGAG